MVSQWKVLTDSADIREWGHKTKPYKISLIKVKPLHYTKGKPKIADEQKFYVQWYKKMFSGGFNPQGGRYFSGRGSAMTYVKSLKNRINNF